MKHRRIAQWRLLLVLALVLNGAVMGAFPFPALASTATSAATPSDPTPGIGDTITVTINIDVSSLAAPDNKLGSFTGTLNWDTAILTYVSNAGLPSGFTGVVNDADAGTGTITFNGANAMGATGNITAVTITFDVAGAGTTTLDLAYSAMSTATYFTNLLPVTITDGEVTVTSPVTCYALTRTHTGSGSDPTANPTNSIGCQPGNYVEGELITLTAAPASGYMVGSWTGTTNNSSTSTTNQVTMPDDDHTATVNYVEATTDCPGAEASAIPSHAAPLVGSTITVRIYMDMTGVAAPHNYLGSFTGSLDWNPAVLDYVSNSGWPSGWSGVVNELNVGTGHLAFNAANAGGATGAGDALTITFNVVGAGTSDLDLEFSAMAAATTFCDLLPGLTVNDAEIVATGEAPECPGAEASAIPSDAGPEVGDTITVRIRHDMTGVAAPHNYLASFTGSLTWNPAVLQYVSNSGWPSGWSGAINEDNVATGQLAFNAAHPSGATGAGDALTITFNVVGAGTSALDLEYSAMTAASTLCDLLPGLTVNDGQVVATGQVTGCDGAESSAIPDNAAPAVGTQVVVRVQIDMTAVAAPHDYLGSFTGSLDWNPAVLQYVSNSGILNGFSGVVNDANAGTGQLAFNGAKADGASGAIDVLTITFNVVGAGTSALDLEYSAMAAATTFCNLLPGLTINDGEVVAAGGVQYMLTTDVDPEGAGWMTPWEGEHTYVEGTVINVTAYPYEGYEFDYWSGACTGSGACQVTMDADKSVTAHFAEIKYKLTMAVDPAGGGTTNPAVGEHEYTPGTVVDITATPAEGYAFDYWSGACSGSGSCQVTMDADKTVTAHFVQIE